MGVLLPRQYNNDCYYYYGNYTCGYSPWNSYGRWIFLGCIIAFAIIVFFLFSCITARRRRRMGAAPYTGTGWALGRAPAGHGQANYNPQSYYNNSNNPPPPAYQSENTGYYANGQNNVELQQPQTAYKPPQGPPPGRM